MNTRSYRRWTLAASVLAVALLFLGLLGALPTQAAPDGGPNTADIAVQFSNGDVDVRRITFTQPSVSGFEALQLAGFDIEYVETDFGVAVCSIENTGCPSTNCFCSTSLYWGYYHLENGQWGYAQEGANVYEVRDDAAELWSWGQTPPLMTPEIAASQAGLDWMRPQQQANGGYGNAGFTIDTILAVASANEDPASWRSAEGNSLLDFLAANGSSYAGNCIEPAECAGKLAMTIAAADADPRNFAGMDLVVSMTNVYNPITGSFGLTNWDQAYSILGWRAAGEAIPMTATQLLASRINPDGGWGYSSGLESEVDSTALMLQALIAGGHSITSTEVLSGVAYLETAQQDNAGFPVVPGGRTNSNSTAFAIQGLIAAGEDPVSSRFTVTSTTPIRHLLDLQLPDGGFAYIDPTRGSNLYATQQIIPALVGKPFPYLSRSVAERNAVEWIAANQAPEGNFPGFGAGSTVDAILALVAAGENPETFESSAGNTPLDYLETQAPTYAANGVSAAGKLLVGIVAAGEDPTTFAGLNLVISVTNQYNAGTGAFGEGDGFNTLNQAYGILALVAAGEEVPDAAVDQLRDIAATGGGWGFSPNADAADVDSTTLVLQALAAANVARADEDVNEAFTFLHTAQNPDGGFPGFSGDTDATSTGMALQALAAYDEDPKSLTWSQVITDGTSSRLTLHTPVDALLQLQSFEGGFAGFSGPSDPFSTYAAVQGLAGVALPARPTNETRIFAPLVIRDTSWTQQANLR